MKIALGTVQFGLTYGAFNRTGQPPIDEIRVILQDARAAGIKVLDTAHAYGTSEAVLGEAGIEGDFKVVTKTPPLTEPDQVGQLLSSFAQSLTRLKAKRVHGLLLHRASDLLGKNAQLIWTALEGLRDQGQVDRIGFSGYGPEEAQAVMQRFPIQLVQLPMSVFDTRHLESGTLAMCELQGIEVHARSVFLQGFALGEPAQLPEHLRPWASLLSGFQEACRGLGLSPLEAALRYVQGMKQVHQVVVGIDRRAQLAQILDAAKGGVLADGVFKHLGSADVHLVDPSTWVRT